MGNRLRRGNNETAQFNGCRPKLPFRIGRRGQRRGCDLPGADTVEYKDPSGWTFTVSLYGWLAGLEGDVGAGGRTAHVDASIGDILDNLDIAVMGLAEARYERFGVFTDLNYVSYRPPPTRRSAFSPAAWTSPRTA